MNEYRRMVAERGRRRRMEEYMSGMKGERWEIIKIKGLGPYSIDRVRGTYHVEFNPRTGKSLPWHECYDAEVVAYDLRLPDGKTRRFSRLIDAKAYVKMLLAQAAAGCHPHSAAYGRGDWFAGRWVTT